jgi:hypothetical protein
VCVRCRVLACVGGYWPFPGRLDSIFF